MYFMHEADDRQWVSTSILDQVLAQWADRLLREHQDGGREEKLATLEKLLSEYYKTSRRFQTPPMELGYHSVALSIAVLGERLMSALTELLVTCLGWKMNIVNGLGDRNTPLWILDGQSLIFWAIEGGAHTM